MFTEEELKYTNKVLVKNNKLITLSTEIFKLLNEYYDNQDMSKAAFFRKVNAILKSEKC